MRKVVEKLYVIIKGYVLFELFIYALPEQEYKIKNIEQGGFYPYPELTHYFYSRAFISDTYTLLHKNRAIFSVYKGELTHYPLKIGVMPFVPSGIAAPADKKGPPFRIIC